MSFIKTIEGKFPLIKNDKVRDILFLIGMSLIVFVETMTTTMFKENLSLYMSLKIVATVFIFTKIIFFDFWSLKNCAFFCISFLISLLVKFYSSYSDCFFWTLLIWGARDINFRKILKCHVFVVFSIVLCAFVASSFGLIENLQYFRNDDIRNSFGICYPTDFAAYIFFLMLSFFYLYKDRLKWWIYSLGLVIAYIVYKYTYARLDCICMTILSILFMVVSIVSPYLKEKANILRTVLCFAIIPLALLCIILSYCYNPEISWMRELDSVFSTRLALGRESFNKLRVTPFGQFFLMVGNGGSTEYRADYFFLDSSYLYVLFRYGVVFTILLLSSFVSSALKRKGDLFFIAAVLVIAINATTAHHLTHVQYNPFFMALFAFFPKESGETEEQRVLS